VIREKGPGRFQLQWEVGANGTDKRQRRTKMFQGTRRQAERELARIDAEVAQGTFFVAAKSTLADFLRRWLDDAAPLTCSPRTIAGHRMWIEKFIIPDIGAVLLATLQGKDGAAIIQGHYAKMLREGRKKPRPDGDCSLSLTSIGHIHRILHRAFKQAILWGLMTVNPCDQIPEPKAQDREMQATDAEGVETLLTELFGQPLYIPVLLAAFCGLRRGEVCGLRWRDLDLEKGTLSVAQAADHTLGKVTMKPPKTKRSRRRMVLPQRVVAALQAHKAAQDEVKAGNPDYQDSDYVCCHKDGSVWRPGALTQSFRWHKAKTSAAHLRFHDLRHSHASILGDAGVPLAEISSRMGHSTVHTTANTYTHFLQGMDDRAAVALDAVLAQAKERKQANASQRTDLPHPDAAPAGQ
jgi:integrase